MKYLLINGPNLNLLGQREPHIYGAQTLLEVEALCRTWAQELGHELKSFQSNHEGALIDTLHDARGSVDAVVLNPGALAPASYALHDALIASEIPAVEIHISNVEEREPWRSISVVEPACVYKVFGRGIEGYRWAIRHLHYRAEHPPFTLRYGKHSDQVGDLRLPKASAKTNHHPVVVLFHGGGWRRQWTRDLMDGAAVDLASRGFAVWNPEYRRIPPTGGWRDSLADAASALDALHDLSGQYPLNLNRVAIIGHSAGGHLGFFACRNARLRPAQFISIGGVLDFQAEDGFEGLIAELLGKDLAAALEQANPTGQVPCGVPTTAIHGQDDISVSPDQSKNFVQAAQAAGDNATFLELAGVGHSDFLDPESPAWAATIQQISV